MAETPKSQDKNIGRREVLKGTGIAAMAAATGAMAGEQAAASNADQIEPRNPYGTKPGYGISLPDYYRPTPSVSNRNFFPPGEVLAKGEMRICFPGSTPWPPTLAQSGTCIMVELGNGTAIPRRMFFDLGNGSVKNILGLQVPVPQINDIFISHLHVDHYHDLSYLFPFPCVVRRLDADAGNGPIRSSARPRYEAYDQQIEGVDGLASGELSTIAQSETVMSFEVNEFDWKDEKWNLL